MKNNFKKLKETGKMSKKYISLVIMLIGET